MSGGSKGQALYKNQSQFSINQMGMEDKKQDRVASTSAGARSNSHYDMHRKSAQLYYREGAMNFIQAQAETNTSVYKM